MHLCAQYYGKPSEEQIREYAEELAQYLNAGYLKEYEFGFEKDDKRIVSWRYKVDENGNLTTDDRPGKVVAYVDIAGAIFFNFLTQNSRLLRAVIATSRRDLRPGFRCSEPSANRHPMAPGTGLRIATITRADAGLNRQTFQPLS